VFGISGQLLRQAGKISVQKKTAREESTATSVSGVFNKQSKKHIKQMGHFDFENDLISLCIDKIAMLDADVKVRGRKGATFPSANRRDHGNGYGHDKKKKQGAWIQHLEDF